MEKALEQKFRKARRFMESGSYPSMDDDKALAHFKRIPAELLDASSAEKCALIMVGMQRAAIDAQEAEMRRMHKIHPVWKFFDSLRVRFAYFSAGMPMPTNREMPQSAA